jgi:lipoyl(octanoyl) transferase
MSDLLVCNLGVVEYGWALELQAGLHGARVQELIGDVLLLLEHQPVYTRGRRAGSAELPMSAEFYADRGIAIFDTDRGGKVTYHGPGQLVGYPIVSVTDVVAYVRMLERSLIAALAELGVSARARVDDGPDYTGVWVADRKIASIGVHVARGVATHGFAINIDNDLSPFEWVVACGLPDVRMTSLARETGRSGLLADFRQLIAPQLAAELGHAPRAVELDQLEAEAIVVRTEHRSDLAGNEAHAAAS